MITHFDRIQERGGQRYGQTDGRTLHDGIGRACVTSRGKNWDVFLLFVTLWITELWKRKRYYVV